MHIEDVTLANNAEDWVHIAYSQASRVGGGTFALVLDAETQGHVVKLTSSEAAYTAFVHFSGASIHFPKVYKHAMNQGTTPDGTPCHALLMEKIPGCRPFSAVGIANRIKIQLPHKHDPLGLLSAAAHIRQDKLTGYPGSLADALEQLGEYAIEKDLKVEMNQLSNWGQRADGSLVLIDLVHTPDEMQEPDRFTMHVVNGEIILVPSQNAQQDEK
jgi:hypothetical protein